MRMPFSIPILLLVLNAQLSLSHEESDSSDSIQLAESLAFSGEQIYKGVTKQTSSSFVFSPLSLHTVLYMLAMGATQGSRTGLEIFQVLGNTGFLPNTDKFDESLIDLAKDYAESSITFQTQIWVAENTTLQESYRDRVNKMKVGVDNLDFSSPQAIKTINSWAKKTTRGLISKILDDVAPNTEAILANAVYLEEFWTFAFSEINSLTPFYLSPNNSFNVKMMDRQDKDFEYGVLTYDGINHEVLKIPYNNTLLEFIIILPDKKVRLEGLEQSIYKQDTNKEGYETLIKKLTDEVEFSHLELYVRLPRFRIQSDIKANKILKELGVNRVFTEESELGRLTQSDNLKVNNVVHKAVISVDLDGTEATGVSAIDIVPLSIPKIMIINRPFMFLLMDKVNSIPIMMGRIVDPNV